MDLPRPSLPLLLAGALIAASAAAVGAFVQGRDPGPVSARTFADGIAAEGWASSAGDGVEGDTRRAVVLARAADQGERGAVDGLMALIAVDREATDRGSVGAGIVAARGLLQPALDSESLRNMLASQAIGPEDSRHPELSVRVECARTAGLAGDRSVVPFLLAILRAETPAEDVADRTWERITTLAWVKTRAADALSRMAGVELRFRPDGPWAHQVEEAARLESLLTR